MKLVACFFIMTMIASCSSMSCKTKCSADASGKTDANCSAKSACGDSCKAK